MDRLITSSGLWETIATYDFAYDIEDPIVVSPDVGNVKVATFARSSRSHGACIRAGQASVWAIGVRMSGVPSCANIDPSTYSTML